MPPPSPSDSGIGRIFGGKYLVMDRLGAGGMAVVYRAQEQGMLRRDVAIKVLTPESALSQATIARFLKEAQAISNIGHPNVVQVIELGRTEDGQIYLVMERLLGKTLYEIIKDLGSRGETLTWERLASVVLQVCRALQAAHKQGIIHRDIKPSNVFCSDLDDEQWHIKVLDFGIAKVQRGASGDSAETPLTKEGMFLGTPHYAAPEIIQRRSEDAIDGRVDVFAVGVLMYQCLTGSLPFQSEEGYADPVTVMYRTVHEAPEPLRVRAPERNISPEVEAIVLKAMHRDPDQRYRTIPELIDAIRGLLRKSGVLYDPGATILASYPPAQPARPEPAAVPQPAPTPLEAPTLAPAPSQRTAIFAFMILTLMLCGVIVLAILVLRDARTPVPGQNPAMERRNATVQPASPPRRPAPVSPAANRPLPLPDPPAPEPRTTTPPAPEPSTTTPPAPVPAAPEHPTAEPPAPAPAANTPAQPAPPVDSPPPKAAKAEDPQRKKAILRRLDEFTQEKSIPKCLPISTEFADGVTEDLPVTLLVDPEGHAKVSVAANKVARRVPASADACILGLLRAIVFPTGLTTLKISHTLKFD